MFAGIITDMVQGNSWIRSRHAVLSAKWIFVQFVVQLMPRTGTV